MKEGFRQAMAWLHTWAGLIFGWLLFAIFLTGTLAYFKDETSHWMQPEIPARSVPAETSLALAQDYLQQQAPGASRWIIELPNAREPALSVRWQQTPAKPGERGQLTKKLLDPQTGREVQARDTQGGEFFYRFHFQLQMPYPWGRWLSTLAAMVMFVALISGIITHKKIFKDFFTFRPRKGQRSWLDGHNAVGVLVLPFHLMITYSSLVIFMNMVMPASILAAYNGDTKAFFSEVFPATNTLNSASQPTPLPPLAPMLEKAREQWSGGQVGRVTVNNPGDANASVVLARGASDRVVHDFGSAVTFNGVTGQLLDKTRAQPMPMAIAGTFYGLHMGHFAGPVMRWLYFICGLASTAMIGTGLVIWLGKRQLKQKVRSAEVGTDILKALAELSPSTSLSRLAEHVQMPASKVHRYLQALIASGFAEQNAATNHYGLGREALRVGLAALNSMDVLNVAALPLAELRDDLNETCFLAVWGNQGATVVRIEPAVRAVTVVTQLGSVLPLLSSSTGLVFGAYLPKRETVELRDRELQEQANHALADEQAYALMCEQIRARGLHHVHGLLMPGVDALSAPVLNAMGNVVAVLTVVGPTSLFHADENGPAAQRLLSATRAVSWRMGYEATPPTA
jgi:DNA-binding IclR family transcriptional regulator